MKLKDGEKAVVIGVAADSGCGKSTFMRRARAAATPGGHGTVRVGSVGTAIFFESGGDL